MGICNSCLVDEKINSLARDLNPVPLSHPVLGCSLCHCLWPGWGGGVPTCHQGECLQGRQQPRSHDIRVLVLPPHAPPLAKSAFLPQHAPALSCGWGPPLPTTEMSQGPNSKQGPDPAIGMLLPWTKSNGRRGLFSKDASREKDYLKKGRGRQWEGPKGARQACVFLGTARPMGDLGLHSQSLSCFTCKIRDQKR